MPVSSSSYCFIRLPNAGSSSTRLYAFPIFSLHFCYPIFQIFCVWSSCFCFFGSGACCSVIVPGTLAVHLLYLGSLATIFVLVNICLTVRPHNRLCLSGINKPDSHWVHWCTVRSWVQFWILCEDNPHIDRYRHRKRYTYYTYTRIAIVFSSSVVAHRPPSSSS